MLEENKTQKHLVKEIRKHLIGCSEENKIKISLYPILFRDNYAREYLIFSPNSLISILTIRVIARRSFLDSQSSCNYVVIFQTNQQQENYCFCIDSTISCR